MKKQEQPAPQQEPTVTVSIPVSQAAKLAQMLSQLVAALDQGCRQTLIVRPEPKK
jgi:hypothetical protein